MFTLINLSKARKTSAILIASSCFIALTAQFFVASPALAECSYEEEEYQTGDTVGSLVCMPDGTWQPQ